MHVTTLIILVLVLFPLAIPFILAGASLPIALCLLIVLLILAVPLLYEKRKCLHTWASALPWKYVPATLNSFQL